jgi:hypothetical protein
MGFHMAFDWCESFFHSVPDSGAPAIGHLLNAQLSGSKWLTGDSAGPEASVVMLTVQILLFVNFRAMHRDNKLALPLHRVRQDLPGFSASHGEVA